MARIRTIKPDFWSHPVMGQQGDDIKCMALALLNFSDDEGYFNADPRLVRSFARPFDDDSTIVRRCLAQLEKVGWVEVREHPSHGPIGFIVNFVEHQRIDRPKPSTIKAYFIDDQSTTNRRSIGDESTPEGKGKERKGTGNTAVAEPAQKPKSARTPKPKTEESVETILNGKDSPTWIGYWELVGVFGGGAKNPAPRTTARLYTQALLLTSPETILRKAKGLAGSTSDLKFMPQLAKWLEGQGYLNPDVKPRAARLQTFESKTPEADAAFDAQLEGMTFQEIS